MLYLFAFAQSGRKTANALLLDMLENNDFCGRVEHFRLLRVILLSLSRGGGLGKLCKRGSAMLKWALIFFVISLIAGVFGFTGISAAAAGVARILFFIAVVIFLVFLVLALMAGSAIV
ncbi:membrane protein [Agrobacterium fabrum]|nr:membrane protein [Agrobacterium fabrum]